ncbi:MAG TPA: hypothetical protein VLB04_09650 [Methanotrichaceae archaeon]|nr:hypothetical protein [Methanotrichaceae archaeon]
MFMNRVPMTMKKPGLKQDEECEMEISSSVRRTRGIIKIDPELGRKIAESDELSSLES